MVASENQLIKLIGKLLSRPKVQITRLVARETNPRIQFDAIQGNVVDLAIARQIADTDFLFLATDSIQSRLIFNELVHQYMIPDI
jgi:molybdopterin/thiamine biosynthesis adenylyltransferase